MIVTKDVPDSDEDYEQDSMKDPEQGAKDLELEQSMSLTEFYAARARFWKDVVAMFFDTGAYEPSLTARTDKLWKSVKVSADAKDIKYEEKKAQVLQIRADARTLFEETVAKFRKDKHEAG